MFFFSVLCLLCFVRVCLYVLRGHLLGKGWPLGSRLWCLLWVCHFPIGILGQVWYLIVSIPDLCNLTYFNVYYYALLQTDKRILPHITKLLKTKITILKLWPKLTTSYCRIPRRGDKHALSNWTKAQWLHPLPYFGVLSFKTFERIYMYNFDLRIMHMLIQIPDWTNQCIP